MTNRRFFEQDPSTLDELGSVLHLDSCMNEAARRLMGYDPSAHPDFSQRQVELLIEFASSKIDLLPTGHPDRQVTPQDHAIGALTALTVSACEGTNAPHLTPLDEIKRDAYIELIRNTEKSSSSDIAA